MLKKYKSIIIYGGTFTGKSVFLRKYLEKHIDDENVKFVIIDPKMIEFYKYSKQEKVMYFAKDVVTSIMKDLKPIICDRKNPDDKLMIFVDEYAEIAYDEECDMFFKWMLENRRKLNIELVLASQVKTFFKKEHKDNVDIVIDLKNC